MKPSRHLATSAVFSLALTPLLVWRSLLVLAGGVLVDLDRYLWYVARYRTLRIGKAFDQFQGRDRIQGDPRFFHSIEFLIALVVVCLFYPVIWPFALGVFLHVLLDLLVHKTRGRFWLRLELSQLRCLTLDMVRNFRRRGAPGEPAAKHIEDGE